MASVGILGAGVAGLTAAYCLKQRGHSVTVWEARDRVGGVIRSEQHDGFLVEHGPNSLRTSGGALGPMLEALDLHDKVITANAQASTRYVVRNGRPTALPMSIRAFLTTELFSTRAKVRLLAEPFVSRRSPEAPDESVADFVSRRLGPEVLNYAVAPFVGGVFAAQPDQLSVRHAFERLATLESEYGSLLWGSIRTALNGSTEQPDGPSGLFSFRGGVQTLPSALGDALGGDICLASRVTGLRRDNGGWHVEIEGGPTHCLDAVVSTLPLHKFQEVAFETPVDDDPLKSVSYPPLAVLALGYERSAIQHPLDGFGLLVPPVEDAFDILGTIFSSTLFPERAPHGHVLLTTFVGGARAPHLARRADEEVQRIVERDLRALLGVSASPVFSRRIQWPHAIPQYTLGYGDVKRTLDAMEEAHPGLFFAGNYRNGVSVEDAMTSGAAAAKRTEEAVGAAS